MNSHLESCFSFISWAILFADESDEEGEVMAETKEKKDLELFVAGWRWGVFQHCLKRRCAGCFVRYPPFSLFCRFGLHFSQSMYLSLILMLDSIFAGSELVKEGQCSKKGGQAVGVARAAENWVSSGRIRGGGFLQAPEGSLYSHSHFLCPTPT